MAVESQGAKTNGDCPSTLTKFIVPGTVNTANHVYAPGGSAPLKVYCEHLLLQRCGDEVGGDRYLSGNRRPVELQ